MNEKAFDICNLPEVYFSSIGAEPKMALHIKNKEDYLFIDTTVEKREDNEWTTTAQEYKQITAQIKCLEKRQKQLRDALISMSEHANSIGGGVRLEKTARRGVIEYSRIEALKGIDLDQYRGEMTTYYKITEI